MGSTPPPSIGKDPPRTHDAWTPERWVRERWTPEQVSEIQRAHPPQGLNISRRDSILEAVVSVVYEGGFAGASVTSVCARAKVSRRTFYETFDSLQDCFSALLEEGALARKLLDHHGRETSPLPATHGVDAHGVDAHGVDAHGVDAHGVDAHGVGADGVGADGVEVPGLLLDPRAYRARACLFYLAAQGERGLSPSNREVANAIGVTRHEQISRLLARLAGLGLLLKKPSPCGRANAWALTEHGLRVAGALRAKPYGGGSW